MLVVDADTVEAAFAKRSDPDPFHATSTLLTDPESSAALPSLVQPNAVPSATCRSGRWAVSERLRATMVSEVSAVPAVAVTKICIDPAVSPVTVVVARPVLSVVS